MPSYRSKDRRRGCLSCKVRKIKCDAITAPCLTCVRSRLPCIPSVCCSKSPVTVAYQRTLGALESEGVHSLSGGGPVFPPLVAEQLIPSLGSLESGLGHDDDFGAFPDGSRPILLAMCTCIDSLQQPHQTRWQRIEAHQLYGTALHSLLQVTRAKDGVRVYRRVIELWALLELGIDDKVPVLHSQAWRMHLSGLCGLRSVQTSISTARRGMTLRDFVLDSLYTMQRLMPEIDLLISSRATSRQIDLRKLKVEIRGIHKKLALVAEIRQRNLNPRWGDGNNADTCTLACWLAIRTCLLFTSSVLYGIEQRIIDDPVRRSTQTFRSTRLKLVRGIIADATTVLRAEPPTFEALKQCRQEKALSKRPKMIEGLLVLYPLAVALRECDKGSPVFAAARILLWKVGTVCCLPKALSLVLEIENGDCFGYAEAVDAMVLITSFYR